jgi:hypothetical protein
MDNFKKKNCQISEIKKIGKNKKKNNPWPYHPR